VLLDRVLARRGYALTRIGGGYIDAKTTIEAAKAAGISIHEYVYRNSSAHHKGRTDRIMERIARLFDRGSKISIAEIGTGTGMYLERACKLFNCTTYHVFETDPGWRSYACEVLAKQTTCIVHKCDGTTLKELKDGSIDLVHAHGVFVYTPSLVTLTYISESARVLKNGGKLCFDCYLDSSFGRSEIDKWIESEYRFPIITSSKVLFDHLARSNLKVLSTFCEVHGPDHVDYLVCEKMAPLCKHQVSRVSRNVEERDQRELCPSGGRGSGSHNGSINP
jgi:SAM-dependent methyltransferase